MFVEFFDFGRRSEYSNTTRTRIQDASNLNVIIVLDSSAYLNPYSDFNHRLGAQ